MGRKSTMYNNRINNYIQFTYTNYYKRFSSNICNSFQGKVDYNNALIMLEEEFRYITLPLVLEFENKLKRDFCEYLNVNGIPNDFYNNHKYFKRNYNYPTNTNARSKHWTFIISSIEKLRLAGKLNVQHYRTGISFTTDLSMLKNYDIETILFYMSMGSFFTLLNGIKKSYIFQFAESNVICNNNNFDKHVFFKFLSNIRYLRNRLAHSNQTLSIYLKNEMVNLNTIDSSQTVYNIFSGELFKTILFMLNSIYVKNRSTYLKQYQKLIRENYKLIHRYYSSINLESDLLRKLKKILKIQKKLNSYKCMI